MVVWQRLSRFLIKIQPVFFYKKRRKTLVRWRFFSKPEGPDLDCISAAGGGNNQYL